MAERSILFDLKLDINQLEKNSKEASERLEELKVKQKELKETSGTNTVEYAKLSNEIRATAKELKDNASAIEINERLNKKNTGSLNEQSEALKSAKVAYRNLSEEQRKSPMGEEMRKKMDAMNQSLKDSESAYGDNQREVGNYSNALIGLGGPIGQATNGIKSMSASLKALLLNPVVLVIAGIVAVLGALYKAFTRSEEGQNSMAKASAVVSVIFETIMDVLTMLANLLVDAFTNPIDTIKNFAKAIKENVMNRFEGLLELIPALGRAISALFSGNFSEAGKIATDATAKVALGIENITDKTAEAIKKGKEWAKQLEDNARKAAKIADDRARADVLERELITQVAEANRKRADLLEKAQQRDKFSTEQRIEMLKEAQKVDEDITNKQIEMARIRYEALKLENSLTESNKEAKKAEAEAQAVLINLETQRLTKAKEVTGQIQGLMEREKATRKALHNEQVALHNSLIDTILANEVRTNEIQLKIIDERYKALFRTAKNNTDELIELEKQKNIELLALDDEVKKDAIASLEESLKRELEANKKSVKIQEQLKKAFELDKEKIELDFEAKKIDRENALIDRENEHNKNRLENERKAKNDLALINAELNLKNAKGLENEQEMFKAFQDEKIRIIRENALREIELNNLVGVEADKVRAKALLDEKNVSDTKFEMKKDGSEKEIEVEEWTNEQKTEMALTSANQLSGAMFQVVQNRLTKELNAVTDRYDEEAVKLQKQLDDGLISETEYLTAKNAIDDKFRKDSAKIKQEQFKKQKQADLIQSTINTALAVTKALSSAPVPINFVLAGVSGALGAVQTGLIASQPIPKFAKGGVFGGKSHSNGGTKGTFEDGTQIEVERDEAFFVLNRNATKQIGLLDRINRSTGGVPLMQNGGRVQFESGISAINTANQIDARNNSNNDIMNAISRLPRPVVAVQDINEAQGNLTNIVDFASF
jgi:hypothetical protein